MKSSSLNNPFRLFIALESKEENRENLQCLTNQVMRWSEDVWILDLSAFFGYWQKRAEMLNTGVTSLWRTVFNQLFSTEDLFGAETGVGVDTDPQQIKVISISPAYRACCAQNPWLAALMLNCMRERAVKGLILQKSKFGQSLFRQISWIAWWQGVSAIETHFSEQKFKGFKQAKFRSQYRRLEAAMLRLGFRFPWEMHILNTDGVKKRFGTSMADLWRWTYGRELSPVESLYHEGFPWKNYLFRAPPAVKHHLDYSVILWEQIAPFLREDLDKLCDALGSSSEKVTRLDWHLTFDDLSKLQVPIRFRNPHDLLAEKGDHTTALLQASYIFAAAAREKFPQTGKDSTPPEAPPIISWEIMLSASLIIPDVFYNIFGEISEQGSDIDILLRLENELPVDLNRFSPQKDWLPEDSYINEAPAQDEEETPVSEIDRSLEAVAEDRPLYIRQPPLPLKSLKEPGEDRFLESTMNKWWREAKTSRRAEETARREKEVASLERNYFKHVDEDGNATWIFQDSHGEWYQHGIFG